MSQNPAKPLRVMLVGTTYGQTPPASDPAIDLDKCAPAVLQRYARERSDEARAAVPLLPGATPTLFVVQPMSRAGLAFVSQYAGRQRDGFVLSIACHELTDDAGVTRKATTAAVPGTKLVMADEAWLDDLYDTFGADACAEVAQVALTRAEAGPRALAPFVLPRGRTLPL